VGHIFYKHCEECEICPILEWKEKYSSYEEAYKTGHPLWYGADVIDMLLNAELKHEIAFHGYTHETFDSMSREKAEFEIQEFIRVAGRKGIDAKSIVFPRNKIGHLELFEKFGFTSYRGEEHLPLLTRNKYFFGKIAKLLDHAFAITTPPIYEKKAFLVGNMANLAATQHIFGFDRKPELWLDGLGLPNLRIRKITKAIKKAAEQQKTVHIWAHPWEFRTESDFGKLEFIFKHVAQEIRVGRMKSVSMDTMASLCKEME
jgi:hypothetical protein